MAKQTLGRGLGCVAGGIAVLAASCYSATFDEPAGAPVASKANEIIGGFGANNSSLNAVGSVGVQYAWGEYSPTFCTAVLVADNMVLTARQCAEQLLYSFPNGSRVLFSTGPNAYAPQQQVEVIHFELSPSSPDGYTLYDVGVMYLSEPIADVAPLAVAALDQDALGEKFVGIGYGITTQNYNQETRGVRKLGALTLREGSGLYYEAMFGNFENFFRWWTGWDVPTDCDTHTDDDAGVPDGGSGGVGGSYPPDNWLCDYLVAAHQVYESELLETRGLVHAGGLPGEAQPCDGDQGGPLLRRDADGRLTIYGILSSGIYANEQFKICDRGALYTSFNQTLLDFIARAKQWVDPCGDLRFAGRCDGTVAKRCTGFGEGERRPLEFDCDAVGLTCEWQNDGTVGCGFDDTYFGPTPILSSNERPDVDREVFRSPPQP